MAKRPDTTTVRATPSAVDKLKELREALQTRTPYRVSLSDTIDFAVSSASAALIESTPKDERDERAA